MDQVKINLPNEMIETKMAVLMANGTEIAGRLNELTELGDASENPKEFMNVFSEGMGLLTQLKEICDDLCVLDDLRTLSEMFGGDDN